MVIRGEGLRSCVKVEADILGSPVPNKPTVSVVVKQHFNRGEGHKRRGGIRGDGGHKRGGHSSGAV